MPLIRSASISAHCWFFLLWQTLKTRLRLGSITPTTVQATYCEGKALPWAGLYSFNTESPLPAWHCLKERVIEAFLAKEEAGALSETFSCLFSWRFHPSGLNQWIWQLQSPRQCCYRSYGEWREEQEMLFTCQNNWCEHSCDYFKGTSHYLCY